MIWGSEDVDPYENDEIKLDIARGYHSGSEDGEGGEGDDGAFEEPTTRRRTQFLTVGDESEMEFENEKLAEFVEFYDCADLLPFAYRIIWLHGVKEAVGVIPDTFELSPQEVSALVILQSEHNMKAQKDMLENKKKSERQQRQAKSKMPASSSRFPRKGRSFSRGAGRGRGRRRF